MLMTITKTRLTFVTMMKGLGRQISCQSLTSHILPGIFRIRMLCQPQPGFLYSMTTFIAVSAHEAALGAVVAHVVHQLHLLLERLVADVAEQLPTIVLLRNGCVKVFIIF